MLEGKKTLIRRFVFPFAASVGKGFLPGLLFFGLFLFALLPLKRTIAIGYDFTFYSLVAAVSGFDSWRRLPHFLWPSFVTATVRAFDGWLSVLTGIRDPYDAASLLLSAASVGTTGLLSFIYLFKKSLFFILAVLGEIPFPGQPLAFGGRPGLHVSTLGRALVLGICEPNRLS
jgi:hypothetical protein